ncbi:unnamed protein product [Blepharisma stoltei]|uniref:Gustatory receptor n=1 Tax=Blepharisma stoltei TaxID=1481888 RepID=A0AAU9IQN5_9CILI|nr:unnamed protein product [Blepharisma stoltei]
METGTWIIISLSWLLLLGLAYMFVHYWLLHNFEIQNPFVELLFSATFAASGALLELFLLELTSIEVNPGIWKIIFGCFSTLMLYIVPIYFIYSFVFAFRLKWLLWIIFVVIYLWELSYYWYLTIGTSENLEFLHYSIIEQIKLLGVNGVLISACLSGFGAVNCAYNYFNFFNVASTQADLKEFCRLSKRNIVNLVKIKQKRLFLPLEKKNLGWAKSLVGIFNGSFNSDPKMEALDAELQAAEAIHQQYLQTVSEIVENREKEKLSKTFKGRIYSLFAKFLVIYGIYKVVFSIYNVALQKKYSIDPVTRGLHIFCYIFGLDESFLNFVIEHSSFAFIGILIFTNIRSFANILVSIVNQCGKLLSSGLSSESLLLMLSEVMGAYFMATVIMMRANLPEKKREAMTNALSGVDFFSFHHLFDGAFAISSVITAVILYLKYIFQIKKKTM